jgi:predicted ATP-dependent protease
LALAVAAARPGFNLVVIGDSAARLAGAARNYLAAIAATRPAPADWVYVFNFADPQKPRAISLAPGEAPRLRDAMRLLVEDLKVALPAMFASEDYQARRHAIDSRYAQKQQEAFGALGQRAAASGIAIVRTPLGFSLAPMKDNAIVSPEDFNAWPEETRKATREKIGELEGELERIVRQVPKWEKERREEVRKFDHQSARLVIGDSIRDEQAAFAHNAAVASHLEAVNADLIENAGMFVVAREDNAEDSVAPRPPDGEVGGPFDRYLVNVIVTQSDHGAGAPILEELHPTLGNLVGRIEHVARQGVLATNFRLIRPGALHRANGGYLIADLRHLLGEPYAWEALKRALKRRQIRIEDVAGFLGLASTAMLEPDAIPLDIKIVIIAERRLYYLLETLDPEMGDLFKVLADFDDDVARDASSETFLAGHLAALARDEGLRPLEASAAARLIEEAARAAGDSEKLSLAFDRLADVMIEADILAGAAGRAGIVGDDIERAVAGRIRRAARIRERDQESILREIALIDTAGSRVGQVNGLSVMSIGGLAFGRPSRITCRVRAGAGKVIDIEREVELGGPIHSKGVLILSGFLAGRYALDAPLSLYASLVFEQSYGGVDGDSASAAELVALVSALSGLPVRQDLAITGSVNQHGAIQAIGGANEKIEGFHAICTRRGLTGSQGVLIPAANVAHLMLREEVVADAAAGRFRVFAVADIDTALAILLDRPAGRRGADGVFPSGTINRLVEDRLAAFAAARRAFAGDDVSGDRGGRL